MDTFLYKGDTFFPNHDFPLMAFYYKQKENNSHIHDFHELVVVLNGSGQHVTESLTYPVSVGDVFVLKPQLRHYYSDTNNLKLINILYRPKELNIPQFDIRDIPGYYVLFEGEPSLMKKGQFKSRLNLNMEQLAIVENIVLKLHSELTQRTKGYCFTALGHFMELISYLSRSYTPQNNKFSQKLFRVGAMMNFIERNFKRKISLDDIIREGKMSLSTANRVFRDAVNMTPIDYLIKLRIEYSANLLRNGNFTITEIAMNSGFSDSNYFAKQFKKIMGASPRDYKKMFEAKY